MRFRDSCRSARLIFTLLCGTLALTACLRTSDTPSSGVGGSSYNECPLNQSTAEPCVVSATARFVSTTAGANISAWLNQSAGTTVYASIPNGFYSDRVVAFSDPLLVPQNIRYGVKLFGVEGTDPGVLSTASRDKTYAQLSASEETITYAGQNLPTTGGYLFREVPKIAKDDDGTLGGSVVYVNRTLPVDWTGRTCGVGGTLEQRIADCATQLGSEATWNAAQKANSGQANWRIVTRTGDCLATAPNRNCREVWRDERTRLLWSSRLSESINWCRASGSNAVAGNPSAEADPSSACDQIANQATTGLAVSACFEDGGVSFTSSHVSLTNPAGKGALGRASVPQVSWRLPTLSDIAAANNDGLRFVLPDLGNAGQSPSGTYDWTATVLSSARASAWIFDGYAGGVATNTRALSTFSSGTVGVRCVGH